MTDRERIQRIFSGEPEQMSELIEEYYQDIFQYCYSQTRRESAAYDCTQETFLRVIRYLNRYVEQKKFRAYLFGIARSVCIDFFRKKSESEVGYEDSSKPEKAETDFGRGGIQMERIKEMEQLLKEQKKPVPDPKRVAACKERMMEEISHQVILPSRPLLVRMWESAGYISRWTWGGLLFFCAVGVLMALHNSYQNTLALCSILAPLPGIFLVPELARSFSEGMWEMEQSCYYNLRELLLLKMIVLGLAFGVLLGLGAVMTRVESGSFVDFELWICLPFLAVSSLSFFLLRKIRSRQAEYGIIGIDLMGVCVVIGMWNVKDDLQRMLESDQTAVLLFVLLAVLLGSLVMNGKKFFQCVQNGELVWEELME